jgi:hypothetical protein
VIEAEKTSGPSDLDIAFQTILDVTARHDERDRYAPRLEVITYDLESISNVGTPDELRLELSRMNKSSASTCAARNCH